MERIEVIAGFYTAMLADYGINPSSHAYNRIDWSNGLLDTGRRCRPDRDATEVTRDWRVLQVLHEAMYPESVQYNLPTPQIVDLFVKGMSSFLGKIEEDSGLGRPGGHHRYDRERVHLETLPLNASSVLSDYLASTGLGRKTLRVPLVVDVVKTVMSYVASEPSMEKYMVHAWGDYRIGNGYPSAKGGYLSSLMCIEGSRSFNVVLGSDTGASNTFHNSFLNADAGPVWADGPFNLEDEDLVRAAVDTTDLLRAFVARARLKHGLGPLKDLLKTAR